MISANSWTPHQPESVCVQSPRPFQVNHPLPALLLDLARAAPSLTGTSEVLFFLGLISTHPPHLFSRTLQITWKLFGGALPLGSVGSQAPPAPPGPPCALWEKLPPLPAAFWPGLSLSFLSVCP